jgi:TonB family protein
MMPLSLRVASALVRVWTRLYTLGLADHVRGARREEIESDLWESHTDPERAQSGLQLVARLAAGLADDLGWRFEQEHTMSRHMKRQMAAIVAVALIAVLWIALSVRLSPRAPQPPELPRTLHAATFGMRMPPPPPPPPPRRGDPVQPGPPPVFAEASFTGVDGMTAPVRVKNMRPVYPPIAIAYDLRGTVILDATIDERGRVVDARLVRSIPVLDQPALNAVRQWEFAPTAAGVPSRVIRVTVVYGPTSPRGKSNTR